MTYWVRKDGCSRNGLLEEIRPYYRVDEAGQSGFNACRPFSQFVVSSETGSLLCRIATWEWLTLFLFLLASQSRDWVKIHIPKQSHSSVRHEKDLRYKYKMANEFCFHISSVRENVSVFG